MNKVITSALGLFLSVIAFGEFEVPHLIVYGTAETRVEPDELKWNLSIKTLGHDVEALADQHLSEVSEVIQYLKETGIMEKFIKTSQMQLNENWVYRDRNRLKEGYYAFTSINFKTDDYSSYVSHWRKFSKFKNLTISGVYFDISNRTELRNQTRLQALAAAKQKAENMAAAIGVRLLEPLQIEEESPGFDSRENISNVSFELQAAPPRAEEAISPGQETIYATIKVIFRIAEQ